jgi:hypothetical protein
MDINRVIADVLNQPLHGGSDVAPGMDGLIGGKTKKIGPFKMRRSPFLAKRSAGTRSSKWLIGGSADSAVVDADDVKPLSGGAKRMSGSCGGMYGGSTEGALVGGRSKRSPRRKSPRTGRSYNWSPAMEATKNRVSMIYKKLKADKRYKNVPRNQLLTMAMKMQ